MELGVCPPIPYVPPMDLLQTKENTNTLKVKLYDGTVFTKSIFTKGNQEAYLSHVQAAIRLIGQKGLKEQCKKYSKELKDADVALEAQKQKSTGPWDKSSKEAPDDIKEELKLTKVGPIDSEAV